MPVLNPIQIKRGAGNPPTLATGELAYDTTNNVLWIGTASGNIRVGGQSAQATAAKFGDVAGGNYAEFEADGTLVNKGTATVWQDIDFPIIIRTTGANVPTMTAAQGNITIPEWQINDYNVCEGQELIHGWKEASAGSWHCHILTGGTDTSDRTLAFEVEWFWADTGSALSATTTTLSPDYTIPANTPAKTHLLVPIGTATLTGGHIGGHIWARLKRVAATAGTAPTANPWCSMLQMHLELDTIGSRAITAK